MRLPVVLSFIAFVYSFAEQAPVIGVYTQDSSSHPGKTYIWSVGPRYLQAAGAQVVPIFYKSSQAELISILQQVNGVLFPGGNITIDITKNLWSQNADFIFKYAM